MDLAAARSCFPATRDRVFLDAACVSLLPVQAEAALRRLTENLLLCPAGDASAHHIALDATAEPARRAAARLIGARPEDVALVESTTQGLEIVAATVPLGCGDTVLVGDTEFLGLAVPWVPRQERDGFRIQVVPNRQGRLLAEDFDRAADGHARMILLSSVQWSSGYRADLAAFSDLTQRHNLILVVDAIQQLGAFSLDVGRTPVDFLVCGGHKWLNAPAGRGLLYVHPRHVERLPPAWGYLNVREPAGGWADYFATPDIPAVRPYEFTPTARRFEVGGTANYPGNVVLGAALELIHELGPAAIEAHVRGLTDLLYEELRAVGAAVVTPPEPEARSGIVTFTLGLGPARDAALLARLRDRRILISQRYTAGVGGLRVSCHFFNNADDVRRLAAAVAEERRGPPAFSAAKGRV
jgi:selenocysteine lyase/cysteine desulfurase